MIVGKYIEKTPDTHFCNKEHNLRLLGDTGGVMVCPQSLREPLYRRIVDAVNCLDMKELDHVLESVSEKERTEAQASVQNLLSDLEKTMGSRIYRILYIPCSTKIY